MKKFYLGALALCMMASCQNEDAAVLDTQHVSKMEITASLDNSVGSRTALQDDGNDGYKVVWGEGDLLSVFYGSADAHNQFELNTGAGETTATFKSVGSFIFSSDTENGDNSFANVGYYPYSASTTVSKNNDTYVINTEIPVNQTYAESSFAQNASPMVAVSNGLDFAFKNVASVLRVPLKGDKEIIKATLTAPSNMAGAATVTLTETNGNWMPSANVEDGSAMVVLNCSTPVQLNTSTATDFFFVLAPGTYAAGMVVKFYASDGTYYSYTTQNEQTFNRSEVKYLEDKIYGATGAGHSNGTVGVSEANAELANGVENVDVTVASTDENPTLELPEATSDNPTNINFTSLPEDKVITIQASTESQGGEAENVNLTVPQNDNGYDFNIDLPNSTVTLNANEGQQATYDEVTAATAENTLIIGEGVTVKNLKVRKGHVRVHGKIGAISREDNSDAVTYIICEDGAEIPSNLGEGFQKMSAAEWDLRKEIAAGETEVTLDANIDLTSSLVVSRDLVVNLNNKEIKCASSDVFVVTAGTLTINGEGVVWGSYDNSSSSCAVWAKGTGKAIINGGTYKVGHDGASRKGGSKNWRNDCIYARDNASIEINGGEFMYTGETDPTNSESDGHKFLLNCRDADYKAKTCSITVTGGTFYKFNPGKTSSENPVASYVATGYSSMVKDDYYVVSKGILNEDALKAAVTLGGKITLTSDIVLSSPVEVTQGDVTINLNGRSIKCESSDVFVVTGGVLTLEGQGLVYGSEKNTSSSCAVWAKENGKVVINGGTYKVGHDGASKDKGSKNWRNDCIYARDNASIEINGGEFMYTGETDPTNSESDGHKFLLNCRDADYKAKTCSITVTGGTFYKFNPGKTSSENPVASYVATGYSSMVKDDYYVVSKGILNEDALKAAVTLGGKITLTSDIVLSSPVEVTQGDVTINLNGRSIKCESSDVFVVTGGVLTLEGQGLVYGSEKNTSSSCAVWAKENGKVVINGGTYKVGHDGASKDKGSKNWRNDCIYARDNAQITINGGEFEYTGDINTENFQSDGNRFLLNCRDDDYKAGKCSITVMGGTFHNFNPGSTSSENPVANYVAAGYSSVAGENNTYIVEITK